MLLMLAPSQLMDMMLEGQVDKQGPYQSCVADLDWKIHYATRRLCCLMHTFPRVYPRVVEEPALLPNAFKQG